MALSVRRMLAEVQTTRAERDKNLKGRSCFEKTVLYHLFSMSPVHSSFKARSRADALGSPFPHHLQRRCSSSPIFIRRLIGSALSLFFLHQHYQTS